MDWFDIDHNGIVDGRDFFMRYSDNPFPVYSATGVTALQE